MALSVDNAYKMVMKQKNSYTVRCESFFDEIFECKTMLTGGYDGGPMMASAPTSGARKRTAWVTGQWILASHGAELLFLHKLPSIRA
jgi:hypothetical protein